jgi:hypothetical protein
MRVTKRGNEERETEGTLWAAIPQALVLERRDDKNAHERGKEKRRDPPID